MFQSEHLLNWYLTVTSETKSNFIVLMHPDIKTRITEISCFISQVSWMKMFLFHCVTIQYKLCGHCLFVFFWDGNRNNNHHLLYIYPVLLELKLSRWLCPLVGCHALSTIRNLVGSLTSLWRLISGHCWLVCWSDGWLASWLFVWLVCQS